jgi:hypothetical protein
VIGAEKKFYIFFDLILKNVAQQMLKRLQLQSLADCNLVRRMFDLGDVVSVLDTRGDRRSLLLTVSFSSPATRSLHFLTQTQSSILLSLHHRALVVSISRDESRPHHPEHFEKQGFDGNAVLG